MKSTLQCTETLNTILLISRRIHRYILRSVMEVDAVRSEMVDEVLQHVHLVGRNVVK